MTTLACGLYNTVTFYDMKAHRGVTYFLLTAESSLQSSNNGE
jgi:hypothetical protein